MNYYDNIEDYRKRGIDSDLDYCLIYNPQDSFTVEDIQQVLAVWEGENDGDDWRWVLKLNDGRFVFLQGGCDYTGWDCQSWASHVFADSPQAACEEARKRSAYRHWEEDVDAATDVICQSLLKQVQEGKNKTWSEGKDEEFGLTGG